MHKKYILTLITIIVLSSFINCKSKKIDKKGWNVPFEEYKIKNSKLLK